MSRSEDVRGSFRRERRRSASVGACARVGTDDGGVAGGPSTPKLRWTNPGRSSNARSSETTGPPPVSAGDPATKPPVKSASSQASRRSIRRTRTTPARGWSIAGGGTPATTGREPSSNDTVVHAESPASAARRPARIARVNRSGSERKSTSPALPRTTSSRSSGPLSCDRHRDRLSGKDIQHSGDHAGPFQQRNEALEGRLAVRRPVGELLGERREPWRRLRAHRAPA